MKDEKAFKYIEVWKGTEISSLQAVRASLSFRLGGDSVPFA